MAARDLSEAELDELSELLARTPQPYRPLDVVGLDGYLCGVLVQPRPVPAEEWLPGIFDIDGAVLSARADRAWRARCEALVARRLDALRESLEAEGAFHPLLPLGEEADADAADAEDAAPQPGRALRPWVRGFALALQRLGGGELAASADEPTALALERVLRHLAPVDAGAREAQARLAALFPIASEAQAVDDLVAAVAGLYDATHARRWQVSTVRRAAPKVGRNQPCPCGSGRKFKQCHGA